MSAAPPDFTFASDNTAGLTPEALAGLQAANGGAAAAYGDDAWTARAKALIAGVFATECDVHFVFNGTAANTLALTHGLRSYQSIVCHDAAHVACDECGAPEYFGGHKVLPLPGAQAKLAPATLAPALQRGHGVHYPKPGALTLTQATEWGTLYTPEEIRPLAALAREHGMVVHMDGARFANAVATAHALGLTPADLTWRAGVDVLSFGGTKNGMLNAEAVVFFNRAWAREFAYRVKQGGQLAAKQRFAAAQWCAMLADGAWLRHAAHANAMARRLADGLRALPGAELLAEPAANGVFVRLAPPVAERLGQRGWVFHRFIGDDGYRFMCAWDTPPEKVEQLLRDWRALATG